MSKTNELSAKAYQQKVKKFQEEKGGTQSELLMPEEGQTVTVSVENEPTESVPKSDKRYKRSGFKSYSVSKSGKSGKNAQKEHKQDVHYELFEHIGSIGSSHNGWLREVNVLSWNDAQPGLDIRHWNGDHTKMSRGINLSMTECENLRILLAGLDLQVYDV